MSLVIAIGLGANVGSEEERVERFRAVADTLDTALSTKGRRSPVYRSRPMGPVAEQPPFLNAVYVAEVEEPIDPVMLLAALLDMESVFGRNRATSVPMGPRELDLDILLFGDQALSLDAPVALEVPHPRLTERAFALRPLADLLGPAVQPPGAQRDIGSLLAALGEQGVTVTEYAF